MPQGREDDAIEIWSSVSDGRGQSGENGESVERSPRGVEDEAAVAWTLPSEAHISYKYTCR